MKQNWKIHVGSALDVLEGMPPDSVHCVVTSPPYWGLRDYGAEPDVWGGDKNHDHVFDSAPWKRRAADGGTEGRKQLTAKGSIERDAQVINDSCSCGAWRGHFGLEPLLGMYIEHLVEIMREVWRVLHPTGSVWLNLGDSYWGGKGASSSTGEQHERRTSDTLQQAHHNINQFGTTKPTDRRDQGFKPKDLVMVPARAAIALQDDGWWLRSEIVWAKPNPMPESMPDRPTQAHEKIFLLTKNAMPLVWTHPDGRVVTKRPKPDYVWSRGHVNPPSYAHADRNDRAHKGNKTYPEGERRGIRNRPDLWLPYEEHLDEPTRYAEDGWKKKNLWRSHGYFYDEYAVRTKVTNPGNGDFKSRVEERNDSGVHAGVRPPIDAGARLRNVWTMTTQPYRESHFATFPPELPETCIKAGSSEYGVCSECGAPWERQTETPKVPSELRNRDGGAKMDYHTRQVGSGQALQNWRDANPTQTTGWQPTCGCNALVVPATVLDPFVGSGTTGMMALRLGRSFEGIEVNPEYVEMARKRIINDAPLLNAGTESRG